MLCSLVMGFAVSMAALIMLMDRVRILPGLIGGVTGSIAVGLCIYGAVSYMIKSIELIRMFVAAGEGIGKK